MPPKQNPTAQGDRVSWTSLVGASTEPLILTAYRAQYLISGCCICPEWAVLISAVVFGIYSYD